MAQSAEDAALLLSVMAGFDPRDSTSLKRDKEDYARDLTKPLNGLRIGLPREFFAEGLSADVARAVEAAIAMQETLKFLNENRPEGFRAGAHAFGQSDDQRETQLSFVDLSHGLAAE